MLRNIVIKNGKTEINHGEEKIIVKAEKIKIAEEIKKV